MKYHLVFQKDNDSDGWDQEELDRWKKESVVPRAGDGVFMKKNGWMTVVHVGFSHIENGRRLVLITVK